MDNLKVYPAYKFREYLMKNNYRNYKIVKDTSAQPENGKFRFILMDQKGSVIEDCWEDNEKKAWDLMEEKYIDRVERGQGGELDGGDNPNINILNATLSQG